MYISKNICMYIIKLYADTFSFARFQTKEFVKDTSAEGKKMGGKVNFILYFFHLLMCIMHL